MAIHQELVGIFDRLRWQSPANDFVIGQLREGHCVKGPAQSDEFTPGVCYKFLGRWTDGDPNTKSKYGPSFQFVAAVAEQQHTREGVVQYLTRLLRGHNCGIGHHTANRLYDLYQSDAVRKLRESPAEVAASLRHQLSKCHEAALVLNAERRHEDAKIGLIDLFAGHGFPRNAVRDCIEKWGAKAPAFVRRDPFLLISNRISGAGFLRCDNLFLSLGGNPAKLKRQILAAAHEIRNGGNSNGHTWHPTGVVVEAIRAKIAGATPEPERAMKVGGRCGKFAYHAAGGRIWIADAEQARSEADIVRLVGEKIGQPSQWPTVGQGALTNHQFAELQRATSSGRIAVLCGGPGTGKTFTAAALVRAIIDRHGEGEVAICAPTGKAAVRITEAMQRNAVGLQATTIHRLLCPGDLGYGTGNWNFRHNEGLPLPLSYIVIDESSMIDADLLAALLRAAKLASVLLIGDPHQLPPVGHGAPLRDLLAVPSVPRGELVEVQRNCGAIIQACHAIKAGAPLRIGRELARSFDADHNLALLPAANAASAWTQIERLVESLRQSGEPTDLIEGVQVLVGVNENSDLSRKALNPKLQDLFNHDGERAPGNKYRVGDKAICLSNNNYTDSENTKTTHYVCNGEIGVVQSVSTTTTYIEFTPVDGDVKRTVVVPVKGDIADSFDLAYAITVHKSQGSEWPVVVVLTDTAANRVASREWHYTALSRAQRQCAVIGSAAVLQQQCKRVVIDDRKTFLASRLLRLLAEQQQPNRTTPTETREQPQTNTTDGESAGDNLD